MMWMNKKRAARMAGTLLMAEAAIAETTACSDDTPLDTRARWCGFGSKWVALDLRSFAVDCSAAMRLKTTRVFGTLFLMGSSTVCSAELSCVVQRLETKPICKETGRYIGWPSVAQAANGDLLAVFSGNRSAHISNDGVVQMVRSTDNGVTWGSAATVYDTPIDDRDSGILRTAKGTLVASWFTGPYGGDWQGMWIIRSADNGATWGAPIRVQTTCPHGPIQLKDGRLLAVGQRPHCSHGQPADWNGAPAQSPYTVAVEESRDDGVSWAVISTFPVPSDAQMLSYDEPHVVELASGRLLVLFRDCNGENYIRQSESSDGGLTWSAPVQTPMRGLPPHVIVLRNGWLLTTYAKRWAPYGIFACVSRDSGKTWDVGKELTVSLSEVQSGDLGYPASVQIGDGSIWTVYYQAEKADEKPCLMATHWRFEP